MVSSKPSSPTELRTRVVSSWADRAVASSSAGSMPMARTRAFAVLLRRVMNPLNMRLKAWTGWIVNRAVARGLVMAMFLGTSSPKTMERKVAMMRARTRAVGVVQVSLSPVRWRRGLRNLARMGSAR